MTATKPGNGELAKELSGAPDFGASEVSTTPSRTGNRARVQRYRAKHKRIDYAPSPAALAIIEAVLVQRLDYCLAGVIDRLVLAGYQAISGNGDAHKC